MNKKTETGGEYFARKVAKMTPEQRAARTKRIKRLFARADRLEKKVMQAVQEVYIAEEQLKRAQNNRARLWHLYMIALENCPHPVCL